MNSRLLVAYPEASEAWDKAIVRARTSPLEGAGYAFRPIRWAVGHSMTSALGHKRTYAVQ